MSGFHFDKCDAARVELSRVAKRFGRQTVLSELNLNVEAGEFLVLLGPSGCGKSTLLRMIAGLEPPSEGRILIADQDVTDLPPRQRRIAMVFQSYALYAHLSVADNIAFPLKMQRWHWWYEIPFVGRYFPGARRLRSQYREQAAQAAAVVGLEDYLDRKPRELSGGQRQRVALARAMIHDPAVYLMDEPLSNLDAQLRTQTRAEILRLYRKVGKTFIYVTHDQIEAMTMSTRVIVLNQGVIQQDGTPDDLYDAPANTFVAGFIGSPPMNLVPGNVAEGVVELSSFGLEGSRDWLAGAGLHDGPVTFGIRPEFVHPAEDGYPAIVDLVERLGTEQILTLKTGAGQILAKLGSDAKYKPGESLRLRFDFSGAHLFAKDTGRRIDVPIQNKKVLEAV